MMRRMAWVMIVASAALSSACGTPNPLVGRWTSTQMFPPAGAGQPGEMGTIVVTADFGADNSYSSTLTGNGGCSGSLQLNGYKITLTPSTATSGSFSVSTLGTCTGGPIQCMFGGRMVPVASCDAATGNPMGMPSQYVLSSDGRTATIGGGMYTRVN